MTESIKLETFQKSLNKIFCFNRRGTRKIKDLPVLFNKEIYNLIHPSI